MNKIGSEPCPKCGHVVDGAKFVRASVSEHNAYAGKLERICTYCGYTWYENSLDHRMDA